ncbi:NTE family protein [Microterricola viridarii]|uniref:NTE family protein n=1 Tax=Microterricola viridarii TaxID=412690 RepID=A0A1H1WMM5_9MICO|nr:NTE family protein [Microterricola viridarii]
MGGGGSLGNAWLIGVVAGLAEGGVDVSQADLIVGTSAGSTAAAQVTGAPPAALLADILAAPAPPQTRPAGSDRGTAPARPTVNRLDATNAIIAAARDAADMRRRMGESGIELAAAAPESAQNRWRATVAARLPGPLWPPQRVLITAVDADTGEPVVFDRTSGIDLVDAVAASCASGPAYGIGDRRYIDGGYRTNADNADLAAGCARVLVLSPFAGKSRLPAAWGMHLAAQVEDLRAGGSRVETVFPDEGSRTAFGDNMMDLSRRAPAAKAGFEQGRALAARLAEFWR